MKRFGALVAALVVVLAAIWYWQRSGAAQSAKKPSIPVTVRAVAAEMRDAPHFVASVGTVQAFNTVLVRPRVDGEISRVAFREGQDVRRGDILVEIDRRPLEAQLRSAIAQRDRDQAQLDNVRVDLKRYEFLLQTDSAPRQVLDTTRAQVHQLEAGVNVDAAQVDAAKLQVDYATIRAPIDGRTGARLVDVGNMVHANDATGLVTLTQVRPVSVTFALPQPLLPMLRANQARKPLHVDAMDAGTSAPLGEGELSLIDNQIDVSTGTIRCKATFPNSNEALWPGQYVTARVLLETIPNAILVPAAAIQTGTDGAFVYVVEGAVAKARRVALGAPLGDLVAVREGLKAGDMVVVEGQFQLEPGARVVLK